MANIDYTYFLKRENKIPNLSEDNISSNLDDYIDVYEEEYLINVMGLELYNEFAAGIEEEEVGTQWSNLLTGVEFEYNDSNYKWKGFTNSEKVSPIANYVFFYSVRDEDVLNTGVGAVQSNSLNAERVGAERKLTMAWNRMVELNKILMYLLLSDTDSYSSYDPKSTLTEGIYLNGI